MRTARVIRTPRIGLAEAWGIQCEIARARRQDDAGTVIWLLEHDPTYTTGRHGERSDLWLDDSELEERGARFVRLDRGGQMTWHGPGQTTAYVIANLRELTRGSVRRFVDALVAATADAATAMGVPDARADLDSHGVYVDGRKIGSVGIRVTHGVSLHGLALNRDPDLEWLAPMTACGAPGVPATSLLAEGARTDRALTEAALVDALSRRLDLVCPEPTTLDELEASDLSREAALPTK